MREFQLLKIRLFLIFLCALPSLCVLSSFSFPPDSGIIVSLIFLFSCFFTRPYYLSSNQTFVAAQRKPFFSLREWQCVVIDTLMFNIAINTETGEKYYATCKHTFQIRALDVNALHSFIFSLVFHFLLSLFFLFNLIPICSTPIPSMYRI